MYLVRFPSALRGVDIVRRDSNEVSPTLNVAFTGRIIVDRYHSAVVPDCDRMTPRSRQHHSTSSHYGLPLC